MGNSWNQSKHCGTSFYMAPEVLEEKPYSFKADVYSFGIMMYEIVTGDFPFPLYENGKLNLFKLYHKISKENYRPQFNHPIKPEIKRLIQQCWSNDPNKRPTFQEIFQKLAYNFDDSADDFDGTTNKEGKNKYYLDDVDENEVLSYVDDIDQNNKTFDLQEIKETVEAMIMPIKIENENMKKEIQCLINENIKLKNEITQIRKSFQLLTTVDEFNDLSIKSQIFIISELIEKAPNEKNIQFYMNVKSLLDFVAFYYNEDFSNEYFKIIPQENGQLLNEIRANTQIYIYSSIFKMPDIHEEGGDYLKSLLTPFENLAIEMKYPAKNFKEIEDFVSSIKTQMDDNLQIHLLITSDPGATFQNNNKINCLNFDSKIKYISQNYWQRYNGDFLNCSSLTQVTIPSSVNKIYPYSFCNCASLKDIIFMEKSSLYHIYEGAFKNCTSLKNISIPSSVILIDESCFDGCSSLKNIKIPFDVKSIAIKLFNNCTSLESIRIPSDVKSIGQSAFAGCSSLKQITIPNVDSIKEYTFCGCTSLKTINIPTSVERIENCAFFNCNNLRKLTFDPYSTRIQLNSFLNCTSLTNLIITTKKSKSIKKKFYFPIKDQITYIKITNCDGTIGANVFKDFNSLTKAEISIYTKKIASNAFLPQVIITRFAGLTNY